MRDRTFMGPAGDGGPHFWLYVVLRSVGTTECVSPLTCSGSRFNSWRYCLEGPKDSNEELHKGINGLALIAQF